MIREAFNSGHFQPIIVAINFATVCKSILYSNYNCYVAVFFQYSVTTAKGKNTPQLGNRFFQSGRFDRPPLRKVDTLTVQRHF